MKNKEPANLRHLAAEGRYEQKISQQIEKIKEQHSKGQPILSLTRELLKTIINNNNKQL